MTAENLFKELGYKKITINDTTFKYVHGDQSILFRIQEMTVESYRTVDNDRYVTYKPIQLNVIEMKAIIQQMKELKWLDEETMV